MAWTPAHEGYASRSAHKPSCKGMPSSCSCAGVTELWAISDEECVLTPRTGKWMAFCESGEDADKLWRETAKATRAGLLGWGSKISYKEKARPALMCFTADGESADAELVRTRLRALLSEHGFDSLSLRFKTDEATKAGNFSGQDVLGRGVAGNMVSSKHDMREVCKFFLQNKCTRGSACKFLHPEGNAGGGGGGGGGGEDYEEEDEGYY